MGLSRCHLALMVTIYVSATKTRVRPKKFFVGTFLSMINNMDGKTKFLVPFVQMRVK